MTRQRISDHFVIEEFDCRDGTPVPPTAIRGLVLWARVWGEPLRAAFGPVRVTSGYRTAVYNRRVGGAPNSFHVYDLHRDERIMSAVRLPGVGTTQPVAADVVPARGGPAAWEAWAKKRMRSAAWILGGGRGAAEGYTRQGFVHLDTGPRRTWIA